jgi:hypothetical protein
MFLFVAKEFDNAPPRSYYEEGSLQEIRCGHERAQGVVGCVASFMVSPMLPKSGYPVDPHQ